MSEKLQVLARGSMDRSPSLRDVAAVFFRHQKLLALSFFLVLAAGVTYVVLSPSYKAEMKVMVRRGRIDPAVTPTQTPSPAFEHDEISEEELNSEVELLGGDDILRQVVIDNGLAGKISWISRLRGENRDMRVERAVRRLAGLLLSDARLREMAGDSAQQRVRQHYLWGKVAKEIAAVYEDVVLPSNKKPGGAIGAEGRAA